MSAFDATRGGFGFEKPNDGQSHDWITPSKLIDLLGPFDLDPCESDNQPWPCATKGYRLGRGEDGLVLPWGKGNAVWANPPYGPHVIKWAKKMAEHRNGIFLIFSRTETETWRYIWQTGDAFLFPYGRLCFYLPNGTRAKSGTAPSALIAYGLEGVRRLRECKLAGAFVENVKLLDGVKVSTL